MSKITLALNPDLELKRLGNVMGLPIYVDTSSIRIDEDKFTTYLQVQKILADFFNPPEEV
jgi:hypothetical protein